MVKDNKAAEGKTELSTIQKVNNLNKSDKAGSFAALVADYKAMRSKIDAALNAVKSRNAEKERAKRDEAERARQAELEKKAKPAPPQPEPKPLPKPEATAPAEFEKTAASEPKAEIKTEKKTEKPAASEKTEKKENVRTMTFDVQSKPAGTKVVPSFIRNVHAASRSAENAAAVRSDGTARTASAGTTSSGRICASRRSKRRAPGKTAGRSAASDRCSSVCAQTCAHAAR